MGDGWCLLLCRLSFERGRNPIDPGQRTLRDQCDGGLRVEEGKDPPVALDSFAVVYTFVVDLVMEN